MHSPVHVTGAEVGCDQGPPLLDATPKRGGDSLGVGVGYVAAEVAWMPGRHIGPVSDNRPAHIDRHHLFPLLEPVVEFGG